MTIKINYIDGGVGVEIIALGCVTGDEIIKAHEKIYHPDILQRQKYHIIDRTECTDYNVSTEEVWQIAAFDRAASKTNPNIVIAIISPTDLQFGVSRIWQAYVEETRFNTEIFRDRKSAEIWIKEQLLKT